jgi:hypothetical protein
MGCRVEVVKPGETAPDTVGRNCWPRLLVQRAFRLPIDPISRASTVAAIAITWQESWRCIRSPERLTPGHRLHPRSLNRPGFGGHSRALLCARPVGPVRTKYA